MNKLNIKVLKNHKIIKIIPIGRKINKKIALCKNFATPNIPVVDATLIIKSLKCPKYSALVHSATGVS